MEGVTKQKHIHANMGPYSLTAGCCCVLHLLCCAGVCCSFVCHCTAPCTLAPMPG